MSAAVTILDVEIERLTYHGRAVTTFAQIDRVHRRPDGTAGRTFRENRQRFEHGLDFVEVDQPDEIRRLGLERPQGGTPAKIILLSQRGYLKLTKPLTDDRAWQVQDEMVDRYFVVEKARRGAIASPAKVASESIRLFMAARRAVKALGFDDNQAALSANQATIATTGLDTLGLLGATHLLAPQQERHLTVTEIGERLEAGSARITNKLLERHGYQKSGHSPDGKLQWEPTEKGRAHAVILDTGKRQGGTPVRQLRWSLGIIGALSADIAGNEA